MTSWFLLHAKKEEEKRGEKSGQSFMLSSRNAHPISHISSYKKDRTDTGTPESEKNPVAVLTYIAGMSEDIRKLCREVQHH